MKQKILFPLFVMGVLFYSCSKDSGGNTNTNPGTDSVIATYYTGNTLLIDQLALYTKDGMVTNASAIQNYFDRHVSTPQEKQLFYVNRTAVENPGIFRAIDFYKNNKVMFNNELMEIVETNDSMLVIAPYGSADVPSHDLSPCGSLLEGVPAITPWSNCTPDVECSKYRKTYPVLRSGNNYYLPILNYVVSTSYPEVINDKEVISSCTSVSQEYPMFNTLKEGWINKLKDRDTVLIQTARLPLIKTSK